MSRIVARSRQELLEIIPPTVFFFIAFQVIAHRRPEGVVPSWN